MGKDKSLLVVDGIPLWRRQLILLNNAGIGEVVIVRRLGQGFLDSDVPHISDNLKDVGPIAGLEAALAASQADWVAVLAIDLPALDADWFRKLRSLCRPGVGAVARHRNGFEPLAAIYPRGALEMVRSRISRGEYSFQGLLEELVKAGQMSVLELAESERKRLANWNTPEQ